ncbi:MAG: protein arginine kinase [Gemmatimonadetes bacterium]|nr:protein arginine kinase [Gemmatimonadota bacterium]
MNIEDLVYNAAGWLSGEGDGEGMVVSCRARLARNLAAWPFAPKTSLEDQEKIIEQVLSTAQKCHYMREAVFFQMNALQTNQRQLLVERHLISPALAKSKGQRGVLFNADESLSVMINEEDHLRLQAILPGLQTHAAWQQVDALDDALNRELEWAQSERWGFLTTCPTNTGTGLRISVLIHLPALVLTEDMERVVRGLARMTFAVRGFYGEGTNAVGNLFQISNQVTMGVPEEEIVEKLSEVTQQIMGHEKEAQTALLADASAQVEDKVWRAYGILRHARVLSGQEFMNLLSAVRLGCSLGMIDGLPLGFINQLMIVTQPSHLQAESRANLSPTDRDVRRAELVRRRWAEQGSSP